MLKSKKSKTLIFLLKKPTNPTYFFPSGDKFFAWQEQIFFGIYKHFKCMSLGIINIESHACLKSSVAGFVCNINVQKF